MFEQLVQIQNNLAHAYVLVGDQESIFTDLARWYHDVFDIDFNANPNVVVKNINRFTIADARALSEQQNRTGVGSVDKKIFVISFDSITVEAQNALLKSIEEPSRGTGYFFIVPTDQILLPTIISRVQLLRGTHTALGINFLAMNSKEREVHCATYYGDNKKDIPADRAGAHKFIGGVLTEILHNKDQIENWSDIYRKIEELQKYLLDRSSSVKYICEYITVTLPVIK